MLTKKLLFLVFVTISNFAYSKNSFSFDSYLKTPNHSTHYNIKKANYQFKKALFNKNIQKNNNKDYRTSSQTDQKKSLLLLSIKLDSIKKLHQKKLLQKDVLKNTGYYTNFLKELKNSSIVNDEYIFLENELLKISIANTNKKITFSIITSIFLAAIIILSILFILKNKKNKIAKINLTKQEVTIKELIINGKTNKEIANELHISLNTVKTHISNIYQKLNISNRKDLILNFKN